ncbi:IS1634 family transposase [Candidatus Saccharibacteria bacterium]|nr:IS1634 family transposase [Candidatus Saccharibacteria bacterium]
METEAEIQTYQVDDIPLLVWQQRVMGIPQIIDEVIEPHGNRQGLSVGWTVTVWLSYILSQADHRLSYVESWAMEQHQVLQKLIPAEVSIRDFTDDRLGDVLSYLSDDVSWSAIEVELGQQIMQVYDLSQERVHVDSTSAALYHSPEGNPLVRYGQSKDHRPDLAQFKVMMSSLAPMGMPLATMVVPGNRADDGLYLPVIEQSRQVLQRRGLLYVGDSKMEALSIRAALAAGDDFYLVLLSKKGTQEQLLHDVLEPVWTESQRLTDVYDAAPNMTDRQLLARAFESTRSQVAKVADQPVEWDERMLVVYSPNLAERTNQGLEQRLQRAQEQLLALTPPSGRGRRHWSELAPLQTAVDAILKRHRVDGLLSVSYERQEQHRHVRKYKERPARAETTVRYQLQLSPDEDAIEQVRRTLGWRLFVTNYSAAQFSLEDAVLAYREGPLHEHNFSRLKNRPLGLRPLYVHRQDRMVGLVRLLSLALRLLTLVEFVVRRELHNQQQTLTGLYEGNPARSTHRPSTERLLRAFKPITLTSVSLPGQRIVHLTPLTPLQAQILALLGLPESIYTNLQDAANAIPP